MMKSKRIFAMVLALVMVFSMLPMSAGAAGEPAFGITSATGKAGEEVTVAVRIENNPGVMMYNYGIKYDTTRLELVEMTKGGMDNVGIWTIDKKVLWENNDFTNSYYSGDTVVVKFKIKEDAPAGDAEISIYDFMALDYEGNLVEYTLNAGKITVEEKLETVIPFTKANHTDSGAAIHDKYTGVVGLKVEGIKLAGWTEWQQGGNYQEQHITIYVDPASKDDAATLSLVLAEGQTGSGSIIDSPATVQLTDGAGSYTASYMRIGTGVLAPMLHIPITFKLACAEHTWADATCIAPKTCTVCGITEGEADPDAHNFVDGVCSYCGEVQAPEEPVAEGYTVELPADISTVAGQSVQIPVTVGHTDDTVDVYNAFDFTFSYDPSALELTSTKIDGMTVTDKDGTVHVERYGTDLTVGETALTLEFKALTAGETEVKITSAKVGVSETALDQDAAEASILDNTTVVTVTGYTVTLPNDFEGAAVAYPDEDYTFEAKDKNYDYTVEATIDGEEIEVTNNGDGTFTIPADQITGNIVITSTKEGKKFDVTLTDDIDGEKQAQYMTDYIATLKKEEGYSYNVTVTIDGHEFTGFQYDAATGVITIPGESITGAISIDSGKEELPVQTYTVVFDGDGAGEAKGEKTVKAGEDYTFTINNIAGVSYSVSYVMGDADAVELTPSNGTYTIANVTGDLVITIEKITDLEVEVTEYVTLDGKTMFLVTATQTLADDEALSYDGSVMFWSEQYNAWAYLVITESTLQVEDAEAVITRSVAAKTTLAQTYDVNATNKVDINDAQLVFDMYNNEYQDFEVATMQKFLKADVNGDKAINVNDAAAIVAEIVNAK